MPPQASPNRGKASRNPKAERVWVQSPWLHRASYLTVTRSLLSGKPLALAPLLRKDECTPPQAPLEVSRDHLPNGHPGVGRHGPAVPDHFDLQVRLPHEGVRALELLGVDRVIRVAVARHRPAVDEL